MHTNYNNKKTRYAGSHCLLVVPSGRDVAIFSVLVLAGAAILVGGLVVAFKQGETIPHIAFLGCGGLVLIGGILGFLLRWRSSFDRQLGEFKQSNAFSSTRYPLDAITSVDVKDGGLHEIKRSVGFHREQPHPTKHGTVLPNVEVPYCRERQQQEDKDHAVQSSRLRGNGEDGI